MCVCAIFFIQPFANRYLEQCAMFPTLPLVKMAKDIRDIGDMANYYEIIMHFGCE